MAPAVFTLLGRPADPTLVGQHLSRSKDILLAPAQPRVGSLLIVAAVSHFGHEQVLLLGYRTDTTQLSTPSRCTRRATP